MTSEYSNLTQCRVCGSGHLVPFLNLGLMPLVNRYVNHHERDEQEPKFPLEILFCRDCSLSQLSIVVDPRLLFSEYDYFSSVSKTFQRHCELFAENLRETLILGSEDLVVEIASNDGCMLTKFKALGLRVRGVEPARNLAVFAEARGLPTYCEFWDSRVAHKIETTDGKAKAVVATNVLAHVDDVHEFIRAVTKVLHPQGVFAFEVPYMVNFIERTEFDTTYHEHLSYFLLRPLKQALEANGMQVVDAIQVPIHGGSIRVISQIAATGSLIPKEGVEELLRLEEKKGLYEIDAYYLCAQRVHKIREELIVFLSGLKKNGRKIAAYGASAKGNVLLNYCGLGTETIDFVVDDTPAKQGKLYPGNHLPIVSQDILYHEGPDYLLLLAWNFADELVRNTSLYGASGGRYVIPIPALQVFAPVPDRT